MSTLDQMQAFVAVVEEGSFTAASVRFDISPTAMSKKIAALEKSLNTRLLIRTPRLLVMTDIGKRYYAQCIKVLHEYKLSHLLIQDKNNELSGTLNIVCLRDVAQQLVYPTMAMFLEQYPNIVTNVTLKKEVQTCTLANYDVAIGYEAADVFNDWCCRKLSMLLLYYRGIKPIALKVKAYVDYLSSKVNAA